MKRKIFVKIAVVIVLAFALCGCNAEKPVEDEREQGNSSPESSASQEEITTTTQEIFTTPSVSDTVADDEQLQTDLTNFVSIFTEHDLEITDMQVIKRQTTVEDKVDIVYVSGSATNEAVKFNFNYKMTYNLYNDGWILDEVIKDGYGCSVRPAKRPSDYIIQDAVEHDYNNDYLYDYSSYEIGDLSGDFSTGEYSVVVTFISNYNVAQKISYYRYDYEFDDSEMIWKPSVGGRYFMEAVYTYDLEGIWEGEDYSVEVTMPDNSDLSSIITVITDLRSNKVVYDGYTKEGNNNHNYINFLNRGKRGVNYGDYERMIFNQDGVFYEFYDDVKLTKVS